MKIYQKIRANKEHSKEYLNKLFTETANTIADIRISKGLDTKREIEYFYFGKTDDRGLPNIEIGFKGSSSIITVKYFPTNAELIAFCNGVVFTKRGF